MLKKTLTQEDREKVAGIVLEDLMERFADDFAFDPIIAKLDVDQYGEDYLRILIIFDGDQDRLDPKWTSGLISRIYPKLIASGLPYFPNPGFIEKSEWQDFRRRYGSAFA